MIILFKVLATLLILALAALMVTFTSHRSDRQQWLITVMVVIIILLGLIKLWLVPDRLFWLMIFLGSD